jgi:hypothetical protein
MMQMETRPEELYNELNSEEQQQLLDLLYPSLGIKVNAKGGRRDDKGKVSTNKDDAPVATPASSTAGLPVDADGSQLVKQEQSVHSQHHENENNAHEGATRRSSLLGTMLDSCSTSSKAGEDEDNDNDNHSNGGEENSQDEPLQSSEHSGAVTGRLGSLEDPGLLLCSQAAAIPDADAAAVTLAASSMHTRMSRQVVQKSHSQSHFNPKAPTPLDEDYDTLVPQLRDTPSLFSVEQHHGAAEYAYFNCDTKFAFESYAVMAAIERLELDPKDFPEYYSYSSKHTSSSNHKGSRHAGAKSIATSGAGGSRGSGSVSHSSPSYFGSRCSLNNSIKRKSGATGHSITVTGKDAAEKSRFKRYLTILADENKEQRIKPLSTAKTFATLRNLLLSVLTDHAADRGKSRKSVCLLNGVSILNHHVLTNHNPRILEVAIPILGCLADRNKERQQILASHSSIVCVLSCMRRFEQNPRKTKLLHEECVVALYSMTQLPEAALQFAYTGWGIPLLLQAMTALAKTSITIQKHGFGILLHVAQDNTSHEYIVSKAQSILAVVVAMMTRHTKSASLCRMGCVLLRQTACKARDIDLIQVMIQADVVPCLIRTMKAHSDHFAILRHGFGTLYLLCRGGCSNHGSGSTPSQAQVAVADPKSFVPLVKIVKKHEQHVFIQRESYTLLRSLQHLPSHCFGRVPTSFWNDPACCGILTRAGLYGKVHRGRKQRQPEQQSIRSSAQSPSSSRVGLPSASLASRIRGDSIL